MQITGSMIAAIARLNPYRSPIDVYLAIREGVKIPETPAMRWGRKIERLVAAEYGEQTGHFLYPGPESGLLEHIVHQQHDWAAGLPDRLITRRPLDQLDWGQVVTVLEIKTVGSRLGRDWENGPPVYVVAQALWYWELIRSQGAPVEDWVGIAVLIGGQDFRHYQVPVDQSLLQELLRQGEEFYRCHLVPGVPPEPDASSGWADYFRFHYPQHDPGAVITADEQLEQLIADLLDAREELTQIETKIRTLENRIKLRMGRAERIVSPLGTVTWTSTAPIRTTDWRSACTELLGWAQEYNLPISEAEVVQKYTSTAHGRRIFRINRRD